MEKIESVLPKGVQASSLVDVSKLNLKDEAANRVAMKISEAVLSEYTRVEKPSSIVLAGRISDILKVPIEWVGIIILDRDLIREGGFGMLDKALPQLLKQ